MSRMLTMTQAARRLGLSVKTLQGMIKTGEFPQPVRRNSRWIRVPVADIEEYLRGLEAKRKQQPV
jgi:excisionase family DNA binding protein